MNIASIVSTSFLAANNAAQKAPVTGTPTLAQEMNGDDPKWEKSNWTNGDPAFLNTWRTSNVVFKDGVMSLVLDNKGCPEQCKGKPLASGEYRTTEEYGYGWYQSRFKAAKGNGLVTSFFTFYATPKGKYMDNDEIDFEITGNNTREVKLNYYNDHTTGVEHPEGLLQKPITLGFDAAEGFHDYAIHWTPNSIEWFIDGKLKHTETGSLGPLPAHPGKAIVNLWAGTKKVSGWAGETKYSRPVTAQYNLITYTPENAPSVKPPEPEKKSEASEASKPTGKAFSSSLVGVKPTGNVGADRSPEVAITVRIKNLPVNASTLQGVIRTNQDWPADQAQTGGKTSGDFTFRAYVNSANQKSPFYIKVLDDQGAVIGRAPAGEAMFQIPFPR